MTTPAGPQPGPSPRSDENASRRDDADRSQPDQSQLDPNDPYRFGLPDTPPPPEYAPPGWTPPSGWPAPQGPPQLPPQGQAQPGLPPGYPPVPGQHRPFQHGAPPPPWGPPSQQGPPVYPPYPYAPTPDRRDAVTRRRAITSLVLGGVSILMFWTSFLDAVLVIAAVAFGAIALSGGSHATDSRAVAGRRLAMAGLVCAAVGAAAAVGWTVYLVHLINLCGGFNQPNSPALRACLQRHM